MSWDVMKYARSKCEIKVLCRIGNNISVECAVFGYIAMPVASDLEGTLGYIQTSERGVGEHLFELGNRGSYSGAKVENASRLPSNALLRNVGNLILSKKVARFSRKANAPCMLLLVLIGELIESGGIHGLIS